MTRTIPAPQISPETETYWEAANRDVLLVKTCRACGKAHYYPRVLCPFCLSDETEWTETDGTGDIYAFSVMWRSAVPYALAYVRLSDGPMMLTNIVDCDLDTLAIGQSVKAVFISSESGTKVPMFTPISPSD